MRTIGNRIKEKRIEMGLSQEELARKAGYASRSSIQKIEDSRGVPAKRIKDMADALETTPAYLMGWGVDERELSNSEKEVIYRYREASEEIKQAIDRILGID